MSIASEYNGYDPDNVVIDREGWEICFEDVLARSPQAAERLARVLFYLLEAIENGPAGLIQASNSLKEGIEWAYLYTDTHRAALKLFLLHLEGHLKVPDEPGKLIGGAVERGIREAKKSGKRK